MIDRQDNHTSVSAFGELRASSPDSKDDAIGNDQILSLFTQRSATDGSIATSGSNPNADNSHSSTPRTQALQKAQETVIADRSPTEI